MVELGRIALLVCLGLSAYAVVAGAYAAATGKRRLALSARNAIVACLGAAVVAAAVLLARRSAETLVAWVVPVLGVVIGFFSLLLVGVASPFATQAAPPDGIGLNPSLQNPYMVSHPPALYLGYVGLAVPFAFAMAALFARRTDELCIVLTRRWTLAAWTFLGIGQ